MGLTGIDKILILEWLGDCKLDKAYAKIKGELKIEFTKRRLNLYV